MLSGTAGLGVSDAHGLHLLQEANQQVTCKLWQQIRGRPDRFPGGAQEFYGHRYLKFHDYLGWRDRKVEDDLMAYLMYTWQHHVFGGNRWLITLLKYHTLHLNA